MNDMTINADNRFLYLQGFTDAVNGVACDEALHGILGVTKGVFDSAYGRGFRAGTKAFVGAVQQADNCAGFLASRQLQTKAA